MTDNAIIGPLELRFAKANPNPRIEGVSPQSGRANYLVGDDATHWITGVQTFTQVRWHELYPGVDMVCYARDGQLEYDLIVSPGANPHTIAFDIRGANDVRLSAQGRLTATNKTGGLLQPLPVCYQNNGVQCVPVSGHYTRREDGLIGFSVGPYDVTRPLTIDPVLLFASYLGGNGYDTACSVAVDNAGDIYVAGYTSSTNMPTAAPYQSSLKGTGDAYVMKFTATSLVYATYLGGTDDDEAMGIAVDASGQAVVCGATSSTNFPKQNAFQTVHGGSQDAFITKLSAAGNGLIYSSLLGGIGADLARGVAVSRTTGEAYITGSAGSSNFPTISGWGHIANHDDDIFVARLSATGARQYVTCIGGSDGDAGYAIAIDSGSMPYVFGETDSTNFPVTANAFQPLRSGSLDGVVVHLHGGTTLGYSTHLGGSDIEYGRAIAVDAASNAFVGGFTYSSDFPTKNALQATKSGGRDGFIAKVLPSGTGIVFATYLGGNGSDGVSGMAADSTGGVWVVGSTDSLNFPTRLPVQATRIGAYGDAFISRLSASGTNLQFSTYLGAAIGVYGSAYSQGIGVACAPDGSTYVAGNTVCTDFPTESAFSPQFGGTMDGFLARFGDLGAPALTGLIISNNTMVMSWKSYTGATYNVEGTSELGATNWTILSAATNVAGRRNQTSISDTPGSSTCRFYRVKGSAP